MSDEEELADAWAIIDGQKEVIERLEGLLKRSMAQTDKALQMLKEQM